MDEERLLILSMVQEGKLTAEEAAALIEALEVAQQPVAGEGWEVPPPPTAGPESDSFREARRAAREAREAARETAREMKREMKRQIREALDAQREVRRRLHRPHRPPMPPVPPTFPGLVKLGIHIDKHRHEAESVRLLALDPGGKVVVEARSSDVEVTEHDAPEVRLVTRTVTWGADDDEARNRAADLVEAVSTGDQVVIRVTPTPLHGVGFMVFRDSRVDMSIAVPRGAAVEVTTASGDLDLRELTGSVSAQTSSGDIRATLTGEARLSATSGDISLRGGSLTRLEASATSGDIDISGTGFDHAELTAASGDVTIRPARDASFTFSARSASGDISLGGGAAATDRGRHHVSGTFGDGEPRGRLEITTSSGDIDIG